MKITKTQLRKIIKEEVLKEFGGAYGGRAEDGGDPYAAARAKRAKKRPPPKEMRPEDIENVINKEMIKVFPNLTSLRHISSTDRSGVVKIATQGYYGDPERLRKNAEDFFAGKSTDNQAGTFLKRLKRYRPAS